MTGDGRPFRVLFTASRSWTDAHAVRFALEAVSLDACGREVIVVHGAAEGGDMMPAKRQHAGSQERPADSWPAADSP